MSSKKEKAQTKTNSFENILKSSKRKPNLMEAEDRKNFVIRLCTNLFNNENIGRYSRNTSYRAVFAERCNCNIRDLLKNPVFEKDDGNCVDV